MDNLCSSQEIFSDIGLHHSSNESGIDRNTVSDNTRFCGGGEPAEGFLFYTASAVAKLKDAPDLIRPLKTEFNECANSPAYNKGMHMELEVDLRVCGWMAEHNQYIETCQDCHNVAVDAIVVFQLPPGAYFDGYELVERHSFNWRNGVNIHTNSEHVDYESISSRSHSQSQNLIHSPTVTGIELLNMELCPAIPTGSYLNSSSGGCDCLFKQKHVFTLPLHLRYHTPIPPTESKFVTGDGKREDHDIEQNADFVVNVVPQPSVLVRPRHHLDSTISTRSSGSSGNAQSDSSDSSYSKKCCDAESNVCASVELPPIEFLHRDPESRSGRTKRVFQFKHLGAQGNLQQYLEEESTGYIVSQPQPSCSSTGPSHNSGSERPSWADISIIPLCINMPVGRDDDRSTVQLTTAVVTLVSSAIITLLLIVKLLRKKSSTEYSTEHTK